MSDRRAGMVFVAVQVVLLVLLVVVPRRQDWPTPLLINVVGIVIMLAGVGVTLVAGRGLGTALTPTPVPRPDATLAMGGMYAYMRHPIYSGVLLIAGGIVLRSGSVIALVLGVAVWIFFSIKAAWEERRLAATYPDYPAYAERTPRFVPAVWRRSPR